MSACVHLKSMYGCFTFNFSWTLFLVVVVVSLLFAFSVYCVSKILHLSFLGFIFHESSFPIQLQCVFFLVRALSNLTWQSLNPFLVLYSHCVRRQSITIRSKNNVFVRFEYWEEVGENVLFVYPWLVYHTNIRIHQKVPWKNAN